MPVNILENPPRNLIEALLRGMRQRCPSCGTGKLFTRYLKVTDACPSCGEEMHHHRADDAPPYFTILIVGHLVVPFVLLIETLYRPDLWLQALVWIPATVALALAALPIIKGALIGCQWALYMHGFDPSEREDSATSHSV